MSFSKLDLRGCGKPPGSYPEQWDIAGLKARVEEVLGLTPRQLRYRLSKLSGEC